MSYPLRILLLLSLFVATSANNAWACGHCATGKCGQTASKKSCCAQKSNHAAAHCAGKKCSGSPGSGGCHCPCGTVTGGHAAAALEEIPSIFSLPSSSSDATLRQAFYFAQYMPEAVYLPIWQPPQLGV